MIEALMDLLKQPLVTVFVMLGILSMVIPHIKKYF